MALTGKRTSQAIIVFSAFVAMSANAASISYFLDQSDDLANGTNYVQVTIADGVSGDIDFSVQVLTGAFPAPLTNFGMQSFYFNYNQSLTLDSTNIIDVDPASWDINEDKNVGGGFGKFDFQAKGTGSNRTELLTFTISAVSGDTINDYAIGNADETGEFFAAHVAGYDGLPTGNTSGKFAGSSVVPVPAAVWLFGSALLGLCWQGRRRV